MMVDIARVTVVILWAGSIYLAFKGANRNDDSHRHIIGATWLFLNAIPAGWLGAVIVLSIGRFVFTGYIPWVSEG